MIANRDIEGRWWLLGKPDAVQYGILHFDPDEGLVLETKEARAQSEAEIFEGLTEAGNENDGGTIIGRDRHDQPVTLFFCARCGDESSAGLRVMRFHAGYALMGREVPSWQDVRLNSIRMDFTGLNSWLGFHPFNRKCEDGVAYVGYRYPDDFVFPVQEGVELRIVAEGSIRDGAKDDNSLTLSEKRLFELRWSAAADMKQVHQWTLLLQRFLSLAMGKPVYVRSLRGFMDDRDHQHISTPIVLLKKNSGAVTAEELVLPGETLFSFEDVKEHFGEIFNRWLEYTTRLDAVIDLYFAVVFNQSLYIDHRFLLLAQALERYHVVQIGGSRESPKEFDKRLREASSLLGEEHFTFFYEKLKWANEKTLFQRLNELLETRRGLSADVIHEFPDFAKVVKNTRNYSTHWDPSLEKKAAKGAHLVRLVDCMRLLLANLFLTDLGLPTTAMSHALKSRFVEYE